MHTRSPHIVAANNIRMNDAINFHGGWLWRYSKSSANLELPLLWGNMYTYAYVFHAAISVH